ncbi:hypothetical protein OG923_27905 [Streptomyces halstedii]|uniref:hypothetical protein n=1 Tax=Streptomyces halstedii TaxID=1944 RepID=UPI0032504FDF
MPAAKNAAQPAPGTGPVHRTGRCAATVVAPPGGGLTSVVRDDALPGDVVADRLATASVLRGPGGPPRPTTARAAPVFPRDHSCRRRTG